MFNSTELTSHEDAEITLSLKAIISSVGRPVDFGNTNTFSINDREVVSTIRVRNGETYFLAGLIKTSEIRSWTKVPILSEIPLIGKLFRSKSLNKGHSEVLISITPHVRECSCEEASSYMQRLD